MNTTELKNVTVTITMDEYERLVNNKALADLNDDLCSEISDLQSENIAYQDRIEDYYIPYISRLKRHLQERDEKLDKEYDLRCKMIKENETLKQELKDMTAAYTSACHEHKKLKAKIKQLI